jgi:hypothetical protein
MGSVRATVGYNSDPRDLKKSESPCIIASVLSVGPVFDNTKTKVLSSL